MCISAIHQGDHQGFMAHWPWNGMDTTTDLLSWFIQAAREEVNNLLHKAVIRIDYMFVCEYVTSDKYISNNIRNEFLFFFN